MADLDRRHGRPLATEQGRWWAYCSEHLYGRRFVNGRVLVDVADASPAARRGYVE